MLIVESLKLIIPLFVRKSNDTDQIKATLDQFVQGCIYTINDIETIGEESSVLLCQGFISVLLHPNLMLEYLHDCIIYILFLIGF